MRKKKYIPLFDEDANYAEAKRLIKECREKNTKELDLSNLKLTSVPPEISELKKLRKLIICSEKISNLPKEIGEKLPLTYLALECPDLKVLPDSFAKLKSMKCFKFRRCNLTSIPNYICGWTEMEELEISMDDTFQGPYTKLNNMPKNIGNLKKLNTLKLENANIKKIPDSLGSCPLEHLELTGSFNDVPQTIGNCSKLKTLKLFSDKPVSLPNSVGNLSSLYELDIGAPAIKIPESFGKLASLEEINLSTDDVTLPKSIGGLRSLKKLHLDAVRSLPDSIGNCKNLEDIVIDSDKLTALPHSFCKLKKLKRLGLDTFALKALPASLGNLTMLEQVDILSGALRAFPESMSMLKKLKWLTLDAYNVKELPESFKKLSYVKHLMIEIGKKEPVLAQKKDKLKRKKNKFKKNAIISFEELAAMSRGYRYKLLDSYSIKQLEGLIRSADKYPIDQNDRDVFYDIMLNRFCKIRENFKWTEENKKRIAKVSGEFLKAWEEGYSKAKIIIEALYEKEQDKKSFKDKYYIELILHPEFTFEDDELGEDDYEESDWRMYDIITTYFKPEVHLNICIKYDPVTKDDSDFRENGHIKKDLSWNIEGFGDIALKDYYICYALHELYSHNEWAFSDIPKINSIRTEIKISCDGEKF